MKRKSKKAKREEEGGEERKREKTERARRRERERTGGRMKEKNWCMHGSRKSRHRVGQATGEQRALEQREYEFGMSCTRRGYDLMTTRDAVQLVCEQLGGHHVDNLFLFNDTPRASKRFCP